MTVSKVFSSVWVYISKKGNSNVISGKKYSKINTQKEQLDNVAVSLN